MTRHSPAAIARAQQANELRAWNAAIQRSMDEYAAHPIVSLALLCDCGRRICRFDCEED